MKPRRKNNPNVSRDIFASALAISLATLLGWGIYSVSRDRKVLSSFHQQQAQQQAATVAPHENETFLKGGVLQRDIDPNSTPQDYITVDTGTDVPSYVQHEFTVHAGDLVRVELKNHSTVPHQHGWVLVNPGKMNEIESKARAAGPVSQWIPDSPDVLAFVRITNPGQSSSALFRAPSQPGDYPFMCPFPNHVRVMHGILHVLPSQ